MLSHKNTYSENFNLNSNYHIFSFNKTHPIFVIEETWNKSKPYMFIKGDLLNRCYFCHLFSVRNHDLNSWGIYRVQWCELLGKSLTFKLTKHSLWKTQKHSEKLSIEMLQRRMSKSLQDTLALNNGMFLYRSKMCIKSLHPRRTKWSGKNETNSDGSLINSTSSDRKTKKQ